MNAPDSYSTFGSWFLSRKISTILARVVEIIVHDHKTSLVQRVHDPRVQRVQPAKCYCGNSDEKRLEVEKGEESEEKWIQGDQKVSLFQEL